uniref:collagen alpha-1(I) chain n=1 Tax=Callithrix jacchus TaxID=9483 RepID=UPI0023DD4FC8|nr:collagen alpha-1(I) chain [Callithrix jacchus]
MIAVPGGDGGGCGLRGAAVTSPGDSRTASGQAGGLWAAGAGWRVGAGPRVLVTQTATRARPSRSPAPPPCRLRAGQTHRRAPTEVAGNVRVGHPGRGGTAAEGAEGAGRDPESSADRHGCDWEVWGASLAPPRLLAREPRSRGVRGQGASSFLLLRVKPGTAAPSPRAEAASAALSDAPRPGSLEIRGEPGDPRPRGAGGCAAPAPTGLFREDANSACPREVLGSWMGKSSLTGSQTPHFLTSVLAETGHFRPESSLS